MKDRTLRTARLRVLAFITVAATAVISFTSVQSLAHRAGFGWTDWLFPLSLDAVAAFAMDVWMRRSHAQKSAGALALTAIGLSLAANVGWHYLINGWLAGLLGAIPPSMLAWLLLVLHKHGTRPVAPVPSLEHYDTRSDVVPPAPVPHQENRTAPADPVPAVPTVTKTKPAPRHRRVPVLPTPPAVPVDLEPDPVPVPDRRPVPPESITERTIVMAPIMTEVGAKVAPGTNGDRSKVSPATVSRHLVTVPDGPLADRTDDELARMARTWDKVSRRRVMSEFGVGSARATKIANLAKGA